MSEHINPGVMADITRQFIRGFGDGLIEVTSLNRPNTSWRHVDAAGHVHQWYADGEPATSYNPMKGYYLPTLVRITDVEPTDEYPGRYHYECRECRGNSSVAER